MINYEEENKKILKQQGYKIKITDGGVSVWNTNGLFVKEFLNHEDLYTNLTSDMH